MSLKIGTRIRMIHMPDDPCPIEPGTEGTITYTEESFSLMKNRYLAAYGVAWDNGRTLKVLEGIDRFEVIE
jgi:hypothetical protein